MINDILLQLSGALVRVGCPKKLMVGTYTAEGAGLPADVCTAATTFRISLAHDRGWREAVYEKDLPAAQSDTLVGWVVFSLAYLLACPGSRRLLLEDVATRDKLIPRLVEAASSTNNKVVSLFSKWHVPCVYSVRLWANDVYSVHSTDIVIEILYLHWILVEKDETHVRQIIEMCALVCRPKQSMERQPWRLCSGKTPS